MSLPDHYLLNVVLHAAVLSVAACLAIYWLRNPHRIAITALCGIFSVALLPWISALRPGIGDVAENPAPPRLPAAAHLPEWTVVRIPAMPPHKHVARSHPSSFAMPDPATLAATVWALGSAIAFAAFISAAAKILRWQRTLSKPDDAAWLAIVTAVPDIPGRKCFRISRAEESPCVAGFFKPIIVIPSFLLDPARCRELRWALRHELRHWLGSDSRWSVLLEMARVVQWWNPFAHLLVARWKMAREHVCDLAASDDDRTTYGEFLIAMATKPATRNPLAVTMVRRQRFRSLKARIATVINTPPGAAYRFERRVLALACLAMIGASLMVSCVGVGKPAAASTGQDSSAKESTARIVKAPNIGSTDRPAGKAAHVKIDIKVLAPSGSPAARDGSVLSGRKMQELMMKYARVKGTILTTMPSIGARTGEAATIELLREHPNDASIEANHKLPQAPAARFAGWRLKLNPSLAGTKVRIDAGIDYRFVPGKHFSFADGWGASDLEKNSPIDWKNLVSKAAKGSAELSPGETLAINLGEIENGYFPTVFMTVTPIDSTGSEVKNFEESNYVPKEEVSGKVRLLGTLLDDLDKAGLIADDLTGPDTGIAALFDAKHWETVKAGLGGKALKPVTLRYGKESEPWPELPGVKITVTRYKGEQLLDVQVTMPTKLSRKSGLPGTYSLTCAHGNAVVYELMESSEQKRRGLVVIPEAME